MSRLIFQVPEECDDPIWPGPSNGCPQRRDEQIRLFKQHKHLYTYNILSVYSCCHGALAVFPPISRLLPRANGDNIQCVKTLYTLQGLLFQTFTFER